MDIPTLSGPPGFILLMFAAALAAYLRLVSATARDKIESIISNKDALWPANVEHSEERLKILRSTRYAIRWITLVYFALASLIGIRLALFAFNVRVQNECLYVADGALISVITLSIVMMGVFHLINRWRDDRNFEKMLKYHEGRKKGTPPSG